MPKGQSGQGSRGPSSGGGGRKGGQGQGRGQGKGRSAMSQDGNCVCPNCGETAPHQPGVPCKTLICPKCQSPMLRDGLST